MAFSASALEALERAIASGQRRVTYGDRTVEYHSITEMIRAREAIEKAIAQAGGTITRLRPLRYTGF